MAPSCGFAMSSRCINRNNKLGSEYVTLPTSIITPSQGAGRRPGLRALDNSRTCEVLAGHHAISTLKSVQEDTGTVQKCVRAFEMTPSLGPVYTTVEKSTGHEK